MPIEELKGLRGLSGLSRQEYYDWKSAQLAAGKLNPRTSHTQQEILYNNQQYVNKYGLDAAKSKSYAERMAEWNHDIIQPVFDEMYSPYVKQADGTMLYDSSKGMGEDYFKYNLMDDDAKKELLESGWKTNKEMDKYVKSGNALNRAMTRSQAMAEHMVNDWGWNPYAVGIWQGVAEFIPGTIANISNTVEKGRNDNILADIYNRDLKKKIAPLESVWRQYKETDINQLSDTEVFQRFMQKTKGEDGGIPYIYGAYYDDNGKLVSNEMDNFSIDDMRDFLAKEAVYSQYLGYQGGHDALNNQAQEYVHANQSNSAYWGNLTKDIMISAAAYTADKYNSIRRLSLLDKDADVYSTVDGRVVPTKDVINRNGENFYQSEDGELIPVHKETLSLIALDNMGKDENGEDRGWWENAQFWSKAEQYGTMDEKEQEQYSKLGYSPYKVVYNPGEETDIWYEALKMTSFGIADIALSIAPFGIGAAGRGLSTISKAANFMGKAGRVTGQALSKTAQFTGGIVNPIVSATGIGHAYERGVYDETYIGNLQKIEKDVFDTANQEILNQYNTDKSFRDNVNLRASQLVAELKADETNKELSDAELKNMAVQQVMQEETNNWANEFKKSDKYGRALQEAAESASDAALVTSLTTAAKYGVVNFGWRKYLFKTPKELEALHSKSGLAGITENAEKRLAQKTNFRTRWGRAKEFGKTLGGQFWGGAWTNATDELQSGGGRQMNEDRMEQYLSGMYDGTADTEAYSILDGIASYITGMQSTLGTTNPWRAGLVGGLGSGMSFVVNPGSIVSTIGTKEGREKWNYYRQNKMIGEMANMVFSNGVLNDYYAKKHSAQSIDAHIAAINGILDSSEDLKDLKETLALDMASIDAVDPNDKKALQFLRGIKVIDALQQLQENEGLSTIAKESSIIQEALTTIEELQDVSKLSDEKKEDYLKKYYAENQGTPQSEEQNEKALQELQERAIRMKESYDTYNEVSNQIKQREDETGTRYSDKVKNNLLSRLTLDRFLSDEASRIEEKITGNKEYSTAESVIESYGNKGSLRSHLKSTQVTLKQIEKELEEANKDIEKAEKDIQDYEENPVADPNFEKKAELQVALESARQQRTLLENMKEGLDSKVEMFEKAIEAPASDRVLSADEILRLNPQDRARMLGKSSVEIEVTDDNGNKTKKIINNFNQKQMVEIQKARQQLILKDPTLFQEVLMQDGITRRIKSNKEAAARIMENPEAAAYQLNADIKRSNTLASNFLNDKLAKQEREKINMLKSKDRINGIKRKDTMKSLFKRFRKMNVSLLKYMRDSGMFESESGEIEKAIEWSKMTKDMDKVLSSMDKTQGEAVKKVLDTLLENTENKQEVLDTLGNNISNAASDPFREFLMNLEEIWKQESSTAKITPQQREEFKKKQEEKRKAETERLKKLEEEARKKAEEKAKVEAEKKSTEKKEESKKETPKEEKKGDKEEKKEKTPEQLKQEELDTKLAAYGLTRADLGHANEEDITDEQLAQIAAQKEGNVELVESPTLEQQIKANDGTKVHELPSVEQPSEEGITKIEPSADVLIGNTFYAFEIEPLKDKKLKQEVEREWKKDAGKQLNSWLKSLKIDLQSIIDHELYDISQTNPDVHIMYVNPEAVDGEHKLVPTISFLAVKVTPEIERIHNEENGGVVTLGNGDKYLMIGTLGYNGNAQREVWSPINNHGRGTERVNYFKSNPDESFFIDPKYHTKIDNIRGTDLVKRMSSDTETNGRRKISELIGNGKKSKRNPHGLKAKNLKWYIQQGNSVMDINTEDGDIIRYDKNPENNSGAVFLLVRAADGTYVPAKINPILYRDINDGSLKQKIDELFDKLLDINYETRKDAARRLARYIVMQDGKNDVNIKTNKKDIITIFENGQSVGSFDLNNPEKVNEAREVLKSVEWRINVTKDALKNEDLFEWYDEAGALTTDIAKLGTSNASFTVLAMNDSGNPVEKTTAINTATTSPKTNSDLAKSNRSEGVDLRNVIYRKDSSGNWIFEDGTVVTDTKLLKEIEWANTIKTQELKPVSTLKGNTKIYIINDNMNNPVVISKNSSGRFHEMTKDQAIAVIERIQREKLEGEKKEKLQEEAKKQQDNNTYQNKPGQGVYDTARGAEASTFEEDMSPEEYNEMIANQEKGDFDKELKSEKKKEDKKETEEPLNPQQKASIEIQNRIVNDASFIHLTADAKYYIDEQANDGVLLPRATTVLGADFRATPFGLPKGHHIEVVDDVEFIADSNNNSTTYYWKQNDILMQSTVSKSRKDITAESIKRSGERVITRNRDINSIEDYIDGIESIWTLPSTTLGSGLHDFIEKILTKEAGDPETYEERFPNMTNDNFKNLAREAFELRQRIEKYYDIVGTEITLRGTIEIEDSKNPGTKKTLEVAGTVDVLLRNKKTGAFAIYDFKTKRSAMTAEDKAKWALQQSLYKQILEQKYGAVVEAIEIVPVATKDPTTADGKYVEPRPMGIERGKSQYTKDNKGQLYINNVPYKSIEASIKANEPLTPTALQIQYERLPRDIQKLVKTENKEEYKVPGIEKKEAPKIETRQTVTANKFNSLGKFTKLTGGKVTEWKTDIKGNSTISVQTGTPVERGGVMIIQDAGEAVFTFDTPLSDSLKKEIKSFIESNLNLTADQLQSKLDEFVISKLNVPAETKKSTKSKVEKPAVEKSPELIKTEQRIQEIENKLNEKIKKREELKAKTKANSVDSFVKSTTGSTIYGQTIISSGKGYLRAEKTSRSIEPETRTIIKQQGDNYLIVPINSVDTVLSFRDSLGVSFTILGNEGSTVFIIEPAKADKVGDRITIEERGTIVVANSSEEAINRYVNATVSTYTLESDLNFFQERRERLLKEEIKEKEQKSIVTTPPVKTGEDFNGKGTKSLNELKSEKKLDNALAIRADRKYGRRLRELLAKVFPDYTGNADTFEEFLQSKEIPTTGITDIEKWFSNIESCKIGK